MKRLIRVLILLTAASFAASACDESATGVDRSPVGDRPELARGGEKGSNNDGGGGATGGDAAVVGGLLFADASLSVNGNQSCQTCHEPSEGFAAPLSGVGTLGSVVEGSVIGRFGDRKPPTAAYATVAPIFGASGNNAEGGVFWDGRATGEVLGNPAADQALGPFLNPKEQALPDAACVVYEVAQGSYVSAFTAVWGNAITDVQFPADVEDVCSTPVSEPGPFVQLTPEDRETVENVYHDVARSIAAFEATLNSFDSEFDRGSLSGLKAEGEKLFDSKGKCGTCHDNKGSQPLFTDFEFHNLGVPKNPANPAYAFDDPAQFDRGLFNNTGDPAHVGKFKTPTVRNVARGENRTYMHNGVLQSLVQVVDFYNTRDVLRVCTANELVDLSPAEYGSVEFGGAGCWPPPEYAENLDTKRMGNLGLTVEEVEAIVAFMEALTDGNP